MGAFAGFYVANETGSIMAGLVAAGLGGAFLSLIMALMTVTAKVNQVVAGLALNILGIGLAFFWYRSIYEAEGSIDIPTVETMEAPWEFFPIPWLTILALVMVPVVWVFLYRTKYGLELRSVGHNPEACDMRGVGIISRQYVAVVFGGVMAGLAGSFLSLGSTGLFFPDIISGRGWIALAIVIFGNWRATWVLVGSLLFGFLEATQLALQASDVDLPYQLLLALPFVFPVAMQLGFHPVWFGVIITVLVEIALVTPPVGFNCYILKQIAGDVEISDIFLGTGPFVAMSLLLIAGFTAFPGVVLWLPEAMF